MLQAQELLHQYLDKLLVDDDDAPQVANGVGKDVKSAKAKAKKEKARAKDEKGESPGGVALLRGGPTIRLVQ